MATKPTRKQRRRASSKVQKVQAKPTSSENASAPLTPLSPAPALFKMSLTFLWQHKKLFGGLMLIYALLQLVFVQGVLKTDFSAFNDMIKESFDGSSSVAVGLLSFSYLIGTTGQTGSAQASTYQFIFLMLSTLAFIWALRHVLAKEQVRLRDAYYKGMYPLIPFLLVLFVIGLQLLPFLIGGWLYNVVVSNGIAATGLEQILWLGVFITGAVVSTYFLLSSLFAMYIVTLPDMAPLKALKSARGLVRGRRFLVLRKMLFLGGASLLIVAAIMLPIILALPAIAPWVFYVLSIIGIGLIHTYMYSLYRELIGNG